MACCGDVPTLETLAAVSILREELPALRIRVVNVVDLMKLQPQSEHPHGLGDDAFDALFTRDRPVIFAFHAYPWLIHRLTYRRTNHHNIHVRGYKEEGTITTPFDMTVLNDLDRFHLVMDTIDRLPQTGAAGAALKAGLPTSSSSTSATSGEHGQDLPEIRNWRWKAAAPAAALIATAQALTAPARACRMRRRPPQRASPSCPAGSRPRGRRHGRMPRACEPARPNRHRTAHRPAGPGPSRCRPGARCGGRCRARGPATTRAAFPRRACRRTAHAATPPRRVAPGTRRPATPTGGLPS